MLDPRLCGDDDPLVLPLRGGWILKALDPRLRGDDDPLAPPPRGGWRIVN